ncbi:MAG TPA: neutral/alkaline non-lysosomal ceramidase N-terminal domain-containing protein, partial [Lacipirellulaceae bacterium]|nr:neutral/alkaline non-lysosomal ceramidase N-terminal domain-containing protein [Lacipirellulaceae bacterium]
MMKEPRVGICVLRSPLILLAVSLLGFHRFVVNHCWAVELQVATFNVDVTPPVGSPLCDALVPAMTGVNDPLSARGIVLQAGNQKPVVFVAVDWVGIGNEGHDAWREAIAQACGTEIGRVCVHALHQHDAPGCDFLAERIAAEAGLPGKLFPVEFAREAINRAAAAAAEAQSHLAQVTHVGYGSGRVEKVASNRRILGADGKVQFVRYTATTDPKIRNFPEGTIDSLVRLVSFWSGEKPIAVLSYYATHPQSYYYTGKVSADFVGMARDQAEAAEKAGLHIHFNGAGGNIGAGKYNDGSPENRPVLAGRLAAGMKQAWDNTRKTS